jgi:hypothetical protein
MSPSAALLAGCSSPAAYAAPAPLPTLLPLMLVAFGPCTCGATARVRCTRQAAATTPSGRC